MKWFENHKTQSLKQSDINASAIDNSVISLADGIHSNTIISSGVNEPAKHALKFEENAIISIGDDFEIEASQLKFMLTPLLELTKESKREESI